MDKKTMNEKIFVSAGEIADAVACCAASGEICVTSGEYFLDAPIVLKNIEKPLTITAAEGTRLIGGVRLKGAAPVSGEARRRFFPEARDKILVVDLAENGVKTAGEFVSRGFGRPVSPAHNEIFADLKPLNLSRYPKKDAFLYIQGFPNTIIAPDGGGSHEAGAKDEGFFYDSGQPEKWANPDSALVHGYWSWDWAESYELVAGINLATRHVTTKAPAVHNFVKGQRFCFYNVMEEVTEPGDYYIDRREMKLYFIPFGETAPEELLISVMNEPIVTVENCTGLTVRGFTLEAGCSHGIKITNSQDITVSDCIFRNLGNYGVDVRGKRITITGCDISGCGDGGVRANGGVRRTLERADITIDNNHIHHIARWTGTYQTGVNAGGVGITIVNNLIHDCPHSAILHWGNEMTVQNNEIYSVLLKSGDAGAIYMGRDYTYRGNVISGNFIHHIGSGVGMGTMGIYNDDLLSGTVMENNVIWEASRGVFIGGGREHQIRGNIFVDCYPAIEMDGRGLVWKDMMKTLREHFYAIREVNDLGGGPAQPDVSGERPPYITHYPELTIIDGFYAGGNTLVPPGALIEKNLFCSEKKINFTWASENGDFIITKNKVISPDYFVDYEIGLLNLRDGTDAELYGFKAFDMLKPGLDETRRHAPARVLTGMVKTAEGVVYRYRNLSAQAVEGHVTLYPTQDGERMEEISFTLSVGVYGEGSILLPIKTASVKSVEARSDTPGIRPCRVRF
jgi:hypothetical protein